MVTKCEVKCNEIVGYLCISWNCIYLAINIGGGRVGSRWLYRNLKKNLKYNCLSIKNGLIVSLILWLFMYVFFNYYPYLIIFKAI